MRIVRGLKSLTERLKNPVLTLGNFDGVHLGHQAIFRKVVERARELGGTSIAFTFEPIRSRPRAGTLAKTSEHLSREDESLRPQTSKWSSVRTSPGLLIRTPKTLREVLYKKIRLKRYMLATTTRSAKAAKGA
jgi:hypothetical protein